MIPELWSKANKVTLRTTKNQLNKYKHLIKWKTNESILEVGCGDGQTAKNALHPILPKDYKELCISDFEPNFVERIKNTINIPKLTTFRQDIYDEEMANKFENRFDHIFGFFFLHMLTEPRKALKNIHKMLKPGGQTFLTVFEHTLIEEVMDKMSVHPKWGNYDHKMSPYASHKNSIEAYATDFEAVGFKNFINNIDLETFEFQDDLEWENTLTSVNPVIREVPEHQKEEYNKCFKEYYRRLGLLTYFIENGKQKSKIARNMFIIVADKP